MPSVNSVITVNECKLKVPKFFKRKHMLNMYIHEWMFNVYFFFFPFLLLVFQGLLSERILPLMCTELALMHVCVKLAVCACVCFIVSRLKRFQQVIEVVRLSPIALCRVATSGGDHRHRCGSFCRPYRLHRNHRGVLLHPFSEKYAKLFVSCNVHWSTHAWISARWISAHWGKNLFQCCCDLKLMEINLHPVVVVNSFHWATSRWQYYQITLKDDLAVRMDMFLWCPDSQID